MGKKHLALFNGIGGFQLAAKWAGWENIAHVEIDEWCNSKTAKNFPESKCHKDIFDFNGKEYHGTIDIISGGFPCQPFSVAGKRQGEADNRFLWFEMLRVIREVQPPWVVAENVAGLVSMEDGETLKKILLSLENEGYEVEPFIIPACSVGGWHRRDRIWITGYAKHYGPHGTAKHRGNEKNDSERSQKKQEQTTKFKGTSKPGDVESSTGSQGRSQSWQNNNSQANVTDTCGTGCEKQHIAAEPMYTRYNTWTPAEKWNYWRTEPGVGRVADGIPNRVDRIKALGNAIVPQVAYEIFDAINQTGL